jgi:Domain of unknown function DUF29
MSEQTAPSLPSLFEEDETAWLEKTAELVAKRRLDEIDLENLSEYLTDMARRDRREVWSHLVTLIVHLLKWQHQPELRSNSWRGTIRTQRRELRQLLESGTLRRYAEEVLGETYKDAILQAVDETGLASAIFSSQCLLSLEDVLRQDDES